MKILSKTLVSKVLITNYDIHNNCPFLFKSWKEDRNFIKLKDALRATTAAPTYFAPKYLEVNQEKRVLVDGGVFTNNPAACAYANSKKLFPNEEIVLVSIGTGRLSNRMKYGKLGKIAWIKPLLNVMFASNM